MPNRVRVLQVWDADRVVLERRVADRGAVARDVLRARIVLLSIRGCVVRRSLIGWGARSRRWCGGSASLGDVRSSVYKISDH
jgi:hypothetical protein